MKKKPSMALLYAISISMFVLAYALFGKAGVFGLAIAAFLFLLFACWFTGDWSNAHDDH